MKLFRVLLNLPAMNREHRELLARVNRLERDVEMLKDRTKYTVPCSYRYGPLADAWHECRYCGHPVRSHKTGRELEQI